MIEKLSGRERAEITAVMYNNVFTNEVATGAVCDVLELLEDRDDLRRHKTKHWCVKCRELLRKYNGLLDRRTGGMIGFLADLNDMYDEVVKEDVWRLGNVVRMALNRAKCPETELTARIWLARSLTACAIHNNQHCLKGFPHLRHLQSRFDWMRLTDLGKAVAHLTLELRKCRAVDARMEEMLEKDLLVETGFKALAVKLHDGDGIIDVCNRHAEAWERENGEGADEK